MENNHNHLLVSCPGRWCVSIGILLDVGRHVPAPASAGNGLYLSSEKLLLGEVCSAAVP